jgi:hypothetical protein
MSTDEISAAIDELKRMQFLRGVDVTSISFHSKSILSAYKQLRNDTGVLKKKAEAEKKLRSWWPF